jgi:hypothetical protein
MWSAGPFVAAVFLEKYILYLVTTCNDVVDEFNSLSSKNSGSGSGR